MTLAHAGLGVFVLGAAVETAGRIEAAQALALGQSLKLGAYSMTLTGVGAHDGPNYSAEQGTLIVTGQHGSSFTMTPERRFYPANRQSTSQVAIDARGPSDLYVVFGERREAAPGMQIGPTWLIRAYWNPWARLIFGGPLLMALGGLISLSDRRLRLAAGAKARSRIPAQASA
jgi:cytochrome c-type biogenesis protein CcmF